MQTVNFRCGHCGNLMAVGQEYVGMQVRCPHCQNVVIAPAPAPPSTPAPSPPASGPADLGDLFGGPDLRPQADSLMESVRASEDIFHQPTEAEDALFAHEGPELRMPDAPAPAPPEPPIYSSEAAEPAAPATAYDHSPAAAFTDAPLPWSPAAPTTRPDSGEGPPVESPLPTGAGASAAAASARRPSAASAGGLGWFLPLVFLPVVLYAILVTAMAIYMYALMQTAPKSPFEKMPDIDGDNPGVTRKTLSFDTKFATQPLPDMLKVGLKDTIRVGDVEVTPLRVEARKVQFFTENAANDRPEEWSHKALVLHFRVKNVSGEYAFAPLDNYFDRMWNGKDRSNPPLTFLEAGTAGPFFGGQGVWRSRKSPQRGGEPRTWLVGRSEVEKSLNPGESRETLTATNARDKNVQKVLFGLNEEGKKAGKPYEGPLTWRLHLRRGPIDYKGRMYSATCVVGVTFSSKDYTH